MQRTITLTHRPPVVVDEEAWPIIASARTWNSQHECDATRRWGIFVRQHADGRALVYGWYTSRYVDEHATRVGELIDADEVLHPRAIVDAVLRCAQALDMPSLGDDCIADLPPVVLT